MSWHTAGLICLLSIWGCTTLIGVIMALARHHLPHGLGLLDQYLFLLTPIQILAAAFLLHHRNRHAIIPFALLPFLYFLTGMRISYIPPKYAAYNNGSYFSQALSYFPNFPLQLWLSILFFIGCCLYCHYLRKQGKLA